MQDTSWTCRDFCGSPTDRPMNVRFMIAVPGEFVVGESRLWLWPTCWNWTIHSKHGTLVRSLIAPSSELKQDQGAHQPGFTNHGYM